MADRLADFVRSDTAHPLFSLWSVRDQL